jgi:hypothetical protein
MPYACRFLKVACSVKTWTINTIYFWSICFSSNSQAGITDLVRAESGLAEITDDTQMTLFTKGTKNCHTIVCLIF